MWPYVPLELFSFKESIAVKPALGSQAVMIMRDTALKTLQQPEQICCHWYTDCYRSQHWQRRSRMKQPFVKSAVCKVRHATSASVFSANSLINTPGKRAICAKKSSRGSASNVDTKVLDASMHLKGGPGSRSRDVSRMLYAHEIEDVPSSSYDWQTNRLSSFYCLPYTCD